MFLYFLHLHTKRNLYIHTQELPKLQFKIVSNLATVNYLLLNVPQVFPVVEYF